jgi:hypothetical protein
VAQSRGCAPVGWMGYPISDNRDQYLKRNGPKEDGVERVNDVIGERKWA